MEMKLTLPFKISELLAKFISTVFFMFDPEI